MVAASLAQKLDAIGQHFEAAVVGPTVEANDAHLMDATVHALSATTIYVPSISEWIVCVKANSIRANLLYRPSCCASQRQVNL
ncbi:hypothetical protein AC1031_009929 [Aphanomyces cochlioides]|nr:hypothetical protein AC1031_009929 [Aphanomyces cochlioides]